MIARHMPRGIARSRNRESSDAHGHVALFVLIAIVAGSLRDRRAQNNEIRLWSFWALTACALAADSGFFRVAIHIVSAGLKMVSSQDSQ